MVISRCRPSLTDQPAAWSVQQSRCLRVSKYSKTPALRELAQKGSLELLAARRHPAILLARWGEGGRGAAELIRAHYMLTHFSL